MNNACVTDFCVACDNNCCFKQKTISSMYGFLTHIYHKNQPKQQIGVENFQLSEIYKYIYMIIYAFKLMLGVYIIYPL